MRLLKLFSLLWLCWWLVLGGPIASASPPAKPTKAIKSPSKTQMPNPQQVATSLAWRVDPVNCALCGGYFYQPADLIQHPNPAPMRSLPIHITANGASTFQQDGTSRLTGGVRVTQPGRLMTADTAIVQRSAALGKVTRVTLLGHVHFWQYQQLVTAPVADLDLIHHRITMQQALYHVNTTNLANSNKDVYDAWGYARHVHNPSQSVIKLQHATYSTCSPLHRFWMLSTKRLRLDRARGLGVAHHAVVRIHHIPVAYTPYLRFPIDNRRLSGILWPTYLLSKEQGNSLWVPFYWNMAPNYDSTITTRLNALRGLGLEDVTRYMNHTGAANLRVLGFLDDTQFGHYRNDTVGTFASDTSLSQYVNKLRSMHNQRGYVAFEAEQVWNQAWQMGLHLNYVTDPYFFRDISASQSAAFDANQLLNELNLQYMGDHWQVTGLVQGYQTLHRIDQFNSPTYNQYRRLPELDAGGNYPAFWRQFGFHIDTQLVNFNFDDGGFPTANNTLPTPVGWRFHARPSLSYNHNWVGGYVKPQLYIDETSYASRFQQTTQSATRQPFNHTRVMPIIDVDSGLYFDRDFHVHERHYRQTLVPRVFYLFVPYRNQDKYPDYDTQLLPYSIQQLYSVNRFSGFDRLENANQVGMGLSSQVMQADDGSEILKAQLGLQYYFSDPRVGLPGVVLQHETFSPLVGSLTYDMTAHWKLSSSEAWDIDNHSVNNAGINVQYADLDNRSFLLSYQYVRQPGVDSLGLKNSTEQVTAGLSWPITTHWSGLGYAVYAINRKRAQQYFAGVQYEACCWALRLIYDREWTGVGPDSTIGNINNQYKNRYMFQLLLKGLSGVGEGNESGLVSKLPGYKDLFKKH